MKSTRSQMEAMGLIVVVILISLGILFALKFMINKPMQSKSTFTQKELAVDTLNALLKTTTQCNGVDMTALIQDCAAGSVIECANLDSCAFVEQEIEKALSNTLKQWSKKYNLTIVQSGVFKIRPISFGSCPGSKDASISPIPGLANSPKIFVSLEVCS